MDEGTRQGNLRPLDPDEAPDRAPADFEALSPLNVEALARKPFIEDNAEPNGASIAFLAEFGGRRVLLGADAHPGSAGGGTFRSRTPYLTDSEYSLVCYAN